MVCGETTLAKAITVDAISPELVPDKAAYQVYAEMPGGEIETSDLVPELQEELRARFPVATSHRPARGHRDSWSTRQ